VAGERGRKRSCRRRARRAHERFDGSPRASFPAGVRVNPPGQLQLRLWDYVLIALRYSLAAVFIVFAIPKIAAPDLFAGNIHNYQMLPSWAVNAMALVLPWLELFVGLGLALGLWSRASAFVMAGLMVVFMVAYASARARGLDIACGCFEVGQEAEASSPVWVVMRDVGLLVGAVLLVAFDGGPKPVDLLRRLRNRRPALAA